MSKHQVLGYRVDLINELGRGGFGTVYRGYDPQERVVAMKKISTANRELRRSTSRETMQFYYLKDEQLQQNDHIIKVYDVNRFENAMWIAMEFCDAGNLNEFFLKHGAVLKETEPKVKLMRQIINGVAFLHEKNIVHRDIKPANILLKLSPERHVLVKLGDFGLSKILDPDGQTSAMSSNVGTFVFKAPEFWNRNDDDRIRYHRNIDVYSTGLTFTAMLQAEQDKNLVPRVEGPLEATEKGMPIGLAALHRLNNRQHDICVVVSNPYERLITKQLKKVIRKMTQVSPQDRISAGTVESWLNKMVGVTNLTPCFSPSTDKASPDAICFVNNQLLVRTYVPKPDVCVFKVYDVETGNVTTEWKGRCHHRQGSLAPCWFKDAENLVECCEMCEVLYGYEIATRKVYPLIFNDRNIKPGKMIRGPKNTLIVYDIHSQKILQLACNGKTLREVNELPRPMDWPPQSMCYAEHCNTLVILANTGPSTTEIRGHNMTTGHVVWQQFGTADLQLNVCNANGGVFVTNGNNVLVYDVANGALLETLLDCENVGDIRQAAYLDGTQRKLAVLHGNGQVTCYNITRELCESNSPEWQIFIPEER